MVLLQFCNEQSNIIHKNNNNNSDFFFSDDDDNTEEEVKKLNSELEELQKCLLNGAADLDLVMENKLTTKL